MKSQEYICKPTQKCARNTHKIFLAERRILKPVQETDLNELLFNDSIETKVLFFEQLAMAGS